MRINLTKIGSLRRALAGTMAALLLSGAAALAQPFASPVGSTWDLVMSGNRDGVAHLSFNDDGTFTMEEVLVFKPAHNGSASSDDTRGLGGDDSRGVPPGGSTNGLPVHTNLYGFSRSRVARTSVLRTGN